MNKHPLFKKHIEQAKEFPMRKPLPQKDNWEHFYKMSSNENLLGPSPKAIEAMRNAIGNVNEYDHYDNNEFHEVLAKHHGNGLKPQQFITCNSGVEVIETICKGLVSVGSECIISMPTFTPYENLSELEGGKVINIPLKLPDYALDTEGILSAINEKTALIFITNPNNPTGTYVNKQIMDAFIAKIPDHVIVVYDEVYHHFVDADDFPYAIDYIKEGKNVIALHTFSKIYGLAGLRIGYAFSTPAIGEYLNKIFRPFRIGTLQVNAAFAALKDTEHVKRSQEMVWEGKRWLYKKFEEAAIRYWPTQGNFILFESPIPDDELAEEMLKGGVMVRPGKGFGADNAIRVTIGTKAANQRFWELLKKIMN